MFGAALEARDEPVALGLHGNGGQGANGIDPAGAEHGEAAAPLLHQLQHVDRADEIVLDQLAAAGLAVHAGEHAGVGGRLDDPIAAGQRLQVAGIADVAVMELDAVLAQGAAIGLTAGPDEVVQARDLPVRPAFPQAAGERAADKTADASD